MMYSSKLTILLSFVLAAFAGTAQEKGKKTNAAEAFKTLKPATSSPFYKVTVEDAKAPYRIFINDIPLASSRLARFAFPANTAILQSGRQQIMVQAVNKAARPELKVSITESGVNAPKVLWEYTGKGSPKGEFDATAPANLHNWKQSRTISENNKATIQKAEGWFKQMAAFMLNGKGTAFMDNLIGAEVVTFRANYLITEQALDQHNSWKDYINKGGVKLADRKAAKIEIVGNGKLVHLKNPDGEGALAVLHGNRKTVFDIFLHFPEGKTEPEALLLNMVEY